MWCFRYLATRVEGREKPKVLLLMTALLLLYDGAGGG